MQFRQRIRHHLFALFLIVALAACRDGLAQPSPAELRIERQPTGPVRLELFGDLGNDYAIEAADDPNANAWSPLVTVSLTGPSLTWLDSAWCGQPRRFYRARTFDGPAPTEVAPNFRLIDHLGKTRELNYHWTDTNVAAFVFVFTANGCAAVRDFLPALNALRHQFEPQQVRFWMINSQPEDTRSNLASEAAALGLTLPVLHDGGQFVARAYRATVAPEAMIVSRNEIGWAIVYRGAIDDRKDTNTVASTQHYLAEALTQHLARGTVTPKITPPTGCPLPLLPQPPIAYATDIAPLLRTKCVVCHSPGNIGPFAMTNHDAVFDRRWSILEAVRTGHMPPWHADREHGRFANDNSLKPAEVAKLAQWIEAGAVRGDGPDPLTEATPPSLDDYPFTWPAELGEPDLILSPPEQSVPATGVVDYRYFFVRPPFASNVWLRAAVMLPSNRQLVHHMSVYLGRVTDAMEESLAVYVPGQRQVAYPDGTGKLLPLGTDVTFELHYTPNGTAGTDAPRLGLWLHTNPPPRTLLVGSRGTFPALVIPPFTQEWPVQREATYSRDVLVYGMNPHMHLRGSRMKYEAFYPDGTSEILLSVPHYDFHWQTLYRLETPKRLPAGTRLVVSGAFDNSPQNPHNPDPARTVLGGEQTTDEMFADFLRYAEMLTLLTQPRTAFAARGSRVTFNVGANSPTPPIAYQWRFNGTEITGATASSITISNAQSAHEGEYTVAVSDAAERILSQPASLVVGDPPVIVQLPEAQIVPVGGTAAFRVSVTGTPPFGFSWRKGSTVLTNVVQSETISTFTLVNVRTNDAGNYRVVVTNAFNMSPGLASPLTALTVTLP
jgi:hypothetical protein